VPLIGRLLAEHGWVAYAFSWAGAAVRSIVPFLVWRRTRFLAYAVVVVFHVLTSVLFRSGSFRG
jgi:hypothetical protein